MWKSASFSLLLYFISSGAGSAQQCDFLSPDYFSRSNAASNASACLQRGYTFSIRDSETLDSPLHLAVRETDDPTLFDQLALLIPESQRQSLITLPNANGLNPFQLAVASNRDPAIIVRISKWGDVVNSMFSGERDYLLRTRGKTALHLAAASEMGGIPNVEMVATLLAVGADPTIEDAQDNRPYFYAQKASNAHEMALLLDADTWRNNIAATYGSSELLELAQNTTSTGNLCSDFLSLSFFQKTKPLAIWNCTISWANNQSDSEVLWSLRTKNGDNALHLALKADVDREKLNALLAAADETGGLETALSSQDRNGWSPIHIAADQSTDPLVIVALARWGADVDHIANSRDNGFLKTKTGTTAMHLAAMRKDNERFITALLAMGANPYVYDNNSNDNPLDEPVGLTPLDYLSRSKNLNAMALIAPQFSFCKVVSENKSVVAALAAIGTGTTGTVATSIAGAGTTAVLHSSGALILTGSSGYVAGTLGAVGTVGSGALAVLTAPATLTAAAVSIVALGGTVYYCSSEG